ncbi:MAG TPA: BON domain-containing protein [Terriglobales bacterium]|nr:BON domain-containing protein [Terriglobales bacterium]
MKQLALCLTLLFGTICFAQQQGQPQPDTQQPPYGTPGTFPAEPQAPGQPPTRQIPPDEHAPPPQALSSEQLQQQVTSDLKSEPALEGINVDAQVSDSSVVLTGNVSSEEQHDIVPRIAQSYAGDRKIVDKIKVTQAT